MSYPANAVCVRDVQSNSLQMEFRVDLNSDADGILKAFTATATVVEACVITLNNNAWSLTSKVNMNTHQAIDNGCGFSVQVSYTCWYFEWNVINVVLEPCFKRERKDLCLRRKLTLQGCFGSVVGRMTTPDWFPYSMISAVFVLLYQTL